jgi:DNA polymerase
MNIITLDFETFYDDEIGFKKQTTEEYVRDKSFEVIGVGVKVNERESVWFSGTHKEIAEYLSTFDWDNSVLLCHNTLFDGAILYWKFGIKPHYFLDTLSMARAIHGVEAGGSLASLAERYKIGVKGDEVVQAKGKRRADFDQDELSRYGMYCCNDVELTLKLFLILTANFPEDELDLIDLTLRMYIYPTLCIDDAMLQNRLTEMEEERNELLRGLMDKLECSNEEEVRKKLASNKKFATVLDSFGIDPPIKTSPITGKPTFALAKNDEGFIALTEHEDDFIQHLCAVRLGTKSTMEESRIKRFLNIGGRNKGKLPVPLKYYGAHTGRWAGTDKVNFQNLPSRDKKKKTLKNAIVAPEGHIIINADSSQIEARILAWLAGQEDVVKQFANKEDVYSIFASEVYGKTITKANETERFVGKTCILGLGYGTGATKLKHTLATAKPVNVDLPIEECEDIVKLYREKNNTIPELWRECDKVIRDLSNWGKGKPYYLDSHRCVTVTGDGIKLPNGLYIRYPDLRLDPESTGKYIYKSRKGSVPIWGGTMVENVVQALARIVVGWQMLKISKRYMIAMTVHDSAVVVARDDEKDAALQYIYECMSATPEWAKGLPITCETKWARSYGEC